MIAQRPSFSIEEIRTFIRNQYGLEGSLTSLPGYTDLNYKLDSGDGSFVVKIGNRCERREVLEFQVAALDYLADHWADASIPQVVKTLTGSSHCELSDSEDNTSLVRVLTFLPGQPLSGISPRSQKLLENLGYTLGQLNRCLADFRHLAMEWELPWDLRQAQYITAHTHRIPDVHLRGIIERFLIQFRGRIMPLLPDLPVSVIHNDANDENVLLGAGPDGEWRITGLLDWSDMIRTNTINELAIACAYMTLGAEEPLSVVADVVHGYHRARPISEAEFHVLFPLVCIRLCLSAAMAAIAVQDDPGNDYTQINARRAWLALEQLELIDWHEAENKFRVACNLDSLGTTTAGQHQLGREEIQRQRREVIGASLSLAYDVPLVITSGKGQFLYDSAGRAYLDCVNNVCHVGHCHPRVVSALSNQAAILNTNTRYLHPYLVEYAERLIATLPDPLQVCYFVNSGSEANELAVRLAFAHTKRKDVVVLEDAYHGHTTTLVDMSPYKCEGPGGKGLAPWAHKVTKPDAYRGPHRGHGKEVGIAYAEYVRECCDQLVSTDRPPALFISESILGCGGQIILPDGYLEEAFRIVREAGGICAVDEVQVGFGRVGTHMWAFETQGVVPDIVTLGKPMGNGHPIGAVITTAEIAASFANGMEFFNTYGGNPVSCSVGMAVLDVIEQEELQKRALEVGGYLTEGFQTLGERHPLIGDIRGLGLFMGVELVLDRDNLTPATRETHQLIERVKEDGILLSAEGPFHNVLKIKPPLQFDITDADLLLGAIDRALGNLT
ncbi:aminotransferase class III-fold pyridoxal phosphate-dependent enzyme [Candidatus Neomarinimicrobiota bacterium]